MNISIQPTHHTVRIDSLKVGQVFLDDKEEGFMVIHSTETTQPNYRLAVALTGSKVGMTRCYRGDIGVAPVRLSDCTATRIPPENVIGGPSGVGSFQGIQGGS